MVFLQRLYNDDIRPCLEFRERVLQDAIHRALPELALEINPFRNISEEHHSSDSNTPVVCPLLPALEPAYQLLVKNSEGRIEVNISVEARNRIAATMNLFQYLSCIARGVCSTPQSTNPDRKLSIRRNSQLSGQNAMMKEHMELVKYFKKIQSLRLAIAFARLGFGIPESE
ncbi:glucosamine-fructose-6-phosphate aminotransferase [Clonorchis sinensis]|nr:glucosamine-fructose-6-phosphate aminotransferase [Clonorchis sinensis]